MHIRRLVVGGLLLSACSALLCCRTGVRTQEASPRSPAASRLGINLAGPADWNTELPFVDVFHLSRKWISQRKGEGWGKGPELERDEHGWVKRLEPDCWAETPLCTIQGGHYPAGQYVCLWEGEGKIEFWNIKEVVSSEPGRIVFEPDPAKGGFFLRLLETNPANYVRNIRVIMPGFEETYRANPFHPVFLARWKSLNTYRFMDWMQTNGSEIERWEDRPQVDDCNWTEKGIPLEVMIDLCNRQRMNPWFCMPHRANDDYVRQFAMQVKRDLDPSLKVYVEYSNEIWNSMFEQTRYCGERGLALGMGEKPWEAGWHYCAARSVEIFAIWEGVFGGTDRLVRVMATQSVNPYISEQKLGFRNAYEHCDVLAIAPYFGMNVPEKAQEGRLDAATVATWTVDQLLDHVETNVLPKAIEDMAEQKATADKYGVDLVCYEAGQHLVGVGGGENNDALTKLFQSANRHARMGDLYTRYLDGWRRAGGGLCCIFSSVSRWSKWGSWGLLEYYDQTAQDEPKFRAVMEWNAANAVE
jgi:hypothetical protein